MKKSVLKKHKFNSIIFFVLLCSFPGVYAGTVTVSVVGGMSFSPNTFTCNVGDVIHWTGLTSHNSASTSVPIGAATWNCAVGSSTFDYTVTVAGTYNYKCTPHNFTGTFTASDPSLGINTISEEVFFTIYPNPIKNSFCLQYVLPLNSDLEISAYDLTGKKAETFFTGKKSAGTYKETFVKEKLVSGIYLLNIRIANKNHIQKIIIQ